MKNGEHIDMHHDHRGWMSDIALWRDEIELWNKECAEALADLAKVEAAFRWLSETIDNHERSLDRHVDKITMHEHSVGRFEKTGEGDTVEMLALAKAHKAETARHEATRAAHEALKKQHFTAMVHWRNLLQELAKASK